MPFRIQDAAIDSGTTVIGRQHIAITKGNCRKRRKAAIANPRIYRSTHWAWQAGSKAIITIAEILQGNRAAAA